VGPPVFKTGVGARAPRRVRFPSASAAEVTSDQRRWAVADARWLRRRLGTSLGDRVHHPSPSMDASTVSPRPELASCDSFDDRAADVPKRARREHAHHSVGWRKRDRLVEPSGLLTEEGDLPDAPAVFGEERFPAGEIEADRDARRQEVTRAYGAGRCDAFEVDVLLMAASGYIGLRVECKVGRTERGKASCSHLAHWRIPTGMDRLPRSVGHTWLPDCSFSRRRSRDGVDPTEVQRTCSLGEDTCVGGRE
jgi:hypothetical protein